MKSGDKAVIAVIAVVMFYIATSYLSGVENKSHKELCQSFTIDLSGYEACDEHDFCNLNTGETKTMIRLRKGGIMECRRNAVENVFIEMNEEEKRNEGI